MAVVGPANAGKTTCLHLLDAALQAHPSGLLAYVVKGSPDGTGRYLFHAPDLRQALKERVKGVWCTETIATVGRWIDSARQAVDLVLLDFGGRHADGNERMLTRCSHSLIVCRATETAAESERTGAASWAEVCRRCTLQPLGSLRSLWGGGRPTVAEDEAGRIAATFRADACRPQDTTNREVIARLADHLVALCPQRRVAPYLNLRLARDWRPEDLPSLAGRGERLDQRLARDESLVLGGRAPVWVYGAALHRCLDQAPDVDLTIFDPHVPGGLVAIPSRPSVSTSAPLAQRVTARWAPGTLAGTSDLDIRMTSRDRFLPSPKGDSITVLPAVEGIRPLGDVVLSGAIPIWLHLAYSRWLRRQMPGRSIGCWDARRQQALWVAGPRAAPRAALEPANTSGLEG